MKLTFHPGVTFTTLTVCALLLLCVNPIRAQAPPVPMPSAVPAAAPSPASTAQPSIAGSHAPPTPVATLPLPNMPSATGQELDRVVAIVNGDLILDSDVDQERRFAALLPYGEAGGEYSRDKAIERLINRQLILQQLQLQPVEEISDEAVRKDLADVGKDIPACHLYNCTTPEGLDKFLATQGFTEKTVEGLWRQRMEVLAFIEQRFRMGIRITPSEIQQYYDGPLRAQFAAQHATPPPLTAISDRIQQVLLQQRVTGLLSDWLQSLRAQGSVVVLHPGESAP